MISDTGTIPIDETDEANVPVNSFLVETSPGVWEWIADNFMPRKGRIEQQAYCVTGTRDEILAAVRQHVVPLYRSAMSNLDIRGENYYWELTGAETR